MRLILLAVAAALLIAPAADAKTLISYSREGGFAGIPQALTCSTTGACGKTQLTDRQLAKLKRLIRRADFPSLKTDYRPMPGTVADGFTFTVAYKGKRVLSGDGGTAPPRLTRLLGYLSSLAPSSRPR